MNSLSHFIDVSILLLVVSLFCVIFAAEADAHMENIEYVDVEFTSETAV